MGQQKRQQANRRVAKHTEREFEQITCDWLRFAGRLRPRQAALHHQSEIDAFCLYLEKERGLASASIKSTGVNLARFFKGIPERKLKKLTVTDVEQFLDVNAKQVAHVTAFARSSTRCAASSTMERDGMDETGHRGSAVRATKIP